MVEGSGIDSFKFLKASTCQLEIGYPTHLVPISLVSVMASGILLDPYGEEDE